MTSSLVGSEMCIRDRAGVPPQASLCMYVEPGQVPSGKWPAARDQSALCRLQLVCIFWLQLAGGLAAGASVPVTRQPYST
eukprot:2326647-Prorocentrum_lima.AAC.1